MEPIVRGVYKLKGGTLCFLRCFYILTLGKKGNLIFESSPTPTLCVTSESFTANDNVLTQLGINLSKHTDRSHNEKNSSYLTEITFKEFNR